MKSLPPPPIREKLNNWLEVEPRPPPLPEVVELELDLLLDDEDRSLKRLLVPRRVPRLEVLLCCPDTAVLVEVLVEDASVLEVDVLDVSEEEDEDELPDDPLEEVLLEEELEELEELPAEDGTEVLGELFWLLPPPRLPRNCGAIRAANRSAEMVPDIRMVRFTSPPATRTVGTASPASASRPLCAVFRAGQK